MSASHAIGASIPADAVKTASTLPAAPPSTGTSTSEHLSALKDLHEKEKDLSIDELARAVFSEFDREKRGYISFQVWFRIF